MKNLKGIILLFIANSISSIAQGISMLAIPWYFVRENLFPTFTNVFMISNVLLLFWIPYCGIIIDKYNRKKVFIYSNLISGTILLWAAFIGFQSDGLPWEMIACIFTMTFMNYSIHYPNLYAFVQEIIEPEKYGKITSLLEIQGQASSMLAGAFAAILLEGTSSGSMDIIGFTVNIPFSIEAWDMHQIFLMDGITYVVSLIIISFISYQSIKEKKIETGGIFTRLKSGISFFKKYPEIFVFGVASYCIFVTVMIEGFLIGAKYVDAHLKGGADIYAQSDICYGLGAFFAGFAINSIFKKFSAPQALILLTFLTAGIFFTLYETQHWSYLYFMLFLLGLANAGSRIIRTTFLFKKIPNEVYGRATSIFALSNITFRILFVSIFTLSFFDIGNNIIYAFLILAIFLLFASFVLIKNKDAVISTKSVS